MKFFSASSLFPLLFLYEEEITLGIKVPFPFKKESSSFLNGQRVQCSFNLSRCALWGEVGQILAATLMGPAEPWPPAGPAAPVPMQAETSLPPAQLTPMAPAVLCGQHLKQDARMGYRVGGQPSPKPSFAANTGFGKTSGLRGSEEKWYWGWALCALDRDIESLLPVRYQVGNGQVHQLGYRSSDVHGGFHQPLPAQVLPNVTRLCDGIPTFISSFCLQPISPIHWSLKAARKFLVKVPAVQERLLLGISSVVSSSLLLWMSNPCFSLEKT